MVVLIISTLVTVTREKVIEDDENPRSNLAQVPCIRYPINFKEKSLLALFDSVNKVNIIYATFTNEQGLPIRPRDVGVQKNDGHLWNDSCSLF